MVTAYVVPAKPFKLSHDADGDTPHSLSFATAEQRDHVARELAASTGGIVYTFRWHPTVQSLLLDGGWDPEAHIVPGLDDAAYLTISLSIENRYARYSDLTTRFTNVLIPAPPEAADEAAFNDWLNAHIFPFTGVGHTDGNSWYDVTVTACSDPALIGSEFRFGY